MGKRENVVRLSVPPKSHDRFIIKQNNKTAVQCLAVDSSSFTRFDPVDWKRVDKSFVHLFERAVESCNLRGVYSCQPPDQPSDRLTDSVPIVYVCEAKDENEAQKIHKQVWNQNVVPLRNKSNTGNLQSYTLPAKPYPPSRAAAYCVN